MVGTNKPEKKEKNSLPLTKKTNPNNTGEKGPVKTNTVRIAEGKPAEKKTAPAEDKVFVTLKPKKAPVTEDSLSTRKYAWLAYILFFIPLLINKKSSFVRHNANEGLEINIIDAIGLTLLLCGLLIETADVTAQSLLAICSIVGICLLALTTLTKVYMIVYSAQGREMSTPWMWNLKIIR